MAGKYINTIEDENTGRPVNGATILVYQDGATVSGDSVTSGTLATIYSDDGVTAINQTTSPLTTIADGKFEFYTDLTRVVIAVLFNGVGIAVWNDVDIYDGTGSGDLTTIGVRLDNHDTLIGTAANATDLGTFTGTTITDSVTIKAALQELETAVEATSGAGDVTASGLTMSTARILGRTTASTGAIEEITAGTGLTLSAGDLSVNQAALTSVKPTEHIILACSDESTAIDATGTKLTFRMPYAFTVSAVRASLNSACATGTFTVDINESGTSILSTKLTIDATEKTSTTAAAAAVISDSALADDAEITIDVDNVGDSTGYGLKVTLIGTRT